MVVEFISEDADYAKFINVDIEQEIVSIAPKLEDRAGYYDQAYIRFSFADFPDLQMKV